MPNINELSYDGTAGDFVEIRVLSGEDVSNLDLEVYVKSGSTATLDQTIDVGTGTYSTDGTYDYYVLYVTLENGPRAAIALVDGGALVESVTWGTSSPVSVTGGALDGTSQTSIGDPLNSSSTDTLAPDGSGGWVAASPTPGAANVCLTRGTLIESINGAVPIEVLKIGDPVKTQDQGLQPIRWIGSRKLCSGELLANSKLLPVRITAGSLGIGHPVRDLLVSRQHRMLVHSKIAQRMFGTVEVLIPAIKLIELPGVFVDDTVDSVEYFHLLFDQHQIIFAEGTPTESLFTGPEALKAIGSEARKEILTLFPEVEDLDYAPKPARFVPNGKLQKQLVTRHIKNSQPIQMPLSIARPDIRNSAAQIG